VDNGLCVLDAVVVFWNGGRQLLVDRLDPRLAPVSLVEAALPVGFVVTDAVLEEAVAVKDRVLVALSASRYEL
jgi:hypothetical protein